MPLLSAIGLGVAILVLQALTPVLFREIEHTAILFLKGAQTSATVATDLAASAGSVRIENRRMTLPQAPAIEVR